MRASSHRHALLKLLLVLLVSLGAGAALFFSTLHTDAPRTTTGRSDMALQPLKNLITQDEQAFDPASLQGRYVLLYFGFTLCPDACPTALYNLTLALQQLDADAARIQPLFISVDPARDTPARLADYLAHFSEHFIGLTGDFDVMQQVEQQFGVIAVEHRDATLPGGYTMDHSNEFLLFSRSGKLLTRLPADQSAESLLQQLQALTQTETV